MESIHADLKNIVAVLKSMAQLELTMAKFYQVCAQTMSEEKDFWLAIARQEENHARFIYRMYTIIIARPDRFEKWRNFNENTIATFISGINKNIELIQTGNPPKSRIFYIARDFENAILENKISEIVKTDDVEYGALVKDIIAQTIAHKNAMQSKIAQLEKMP